MHLFDISEPEADTKLRGELEIIVGIDLGTTNSLIGYKESSGQIRIFGEFGSDLIPSIVSYSKEKGAVVGAAAFSDTDAFRAIKRYMGRMPSAVLQPRYVMVDNANLLQFESAQGPKTPTEISAEILRHLKCLAEDGIGKPIRKAVITVPAYFDEAARAATKDAATMAGLEVVRMLSEPTAAAVAYGFGLEGKGVYAVYDLGGGTFDVSILRMESGVLQVLSTSGSTELGGEDFDKALLDYIIDKWSITLSKEKLHEGRLLCCKIRECLTDQETWSGSFLGMCDIALSRDEAEATWVGLITTTVDIFGMALRDAGMDVASLNEVILVGGATRMPCVRVAVGTYCGRPPLCSLDPDKTVAIGAILQAANLQDASSRLLLDVTPLSIKLELAGGIAETVIARNTPIPVTKLYHFTTQKDGQTGFVLRMLQGESDKVEECRVLGHFELMGIPPLAAGVAKLEVMLQIDADGLLTVYAKELSSGIAKELLVKPSYGLSTEELQKLLGAGIVA